MGWAGGLRKQQQGVCSSAEMGGRERRAGGQAGSAAGSRGPSSAVETESTPLAVRAFRLLQDEHHCSFSEGTADRPQRAAFLS